MSGTRRQVEADDAGPSEGRARRRRRWPKVVATLVALPALVIGGALVVTHDPSPTGHWRTDAGQLAFAASYAAAMRLLPEPTRTLNLRTDYGTVRVYEFVTPATRARTPVVLLPVGPPPLRCGSRTCPTSWPGAPSTHWTHWGMPG